MNDLQKLAKEIDVEEAHADDYVRETVNEGLNEKPLNWNEEVAFATLITLRQIAASLAEIKVELSLMQK